jgi:hypothetical protein
MAEFEESGTLILPVPAIDTWVAAVNRRDAEIAKLRAALTACIEYWRDPEIPCPPALHDQVTDALGALEQKGNENG